MTYDDPSLLAAIRAQPEDDNLRLVYSDWLDDHDQPERAEFIRLQCARPVEISPFGSPEPSPGHAYFSIPTQGTNANADLAPQFDLYRKYVRKWNGAIHRRMRGSPFQHRVDSRSGLIRGWSYRRGFPSTLWVHADTVANHLDWVLTIGPIERLVVFGADNTVSINRFDQPSWLNRLAQLLFRR